MSTETEQEKKLVAESPVAGGIERAKRRYDWRVMLRHRDENASTRPSKGTDTMSGNEQDGGQSRLTKWNMGMLNDRETEEVPGSVLLLSKVSAYNEPLGLRSAPRRTSTSSLPSQFPSSPIPGTPKLPRRSSIPEKKRTPDGKIVLDPQPDESANDPLNWKVWRRDAALFSLGFYCMLGGGMTTILAAGFNNVAREYGVAEPRVALTTGLYMLGLGVGSVVLSPTAILYGKRPVYLASAICYVLSSVWCALSPNFPSLICARVFQGIAVSSVECLPSATIAEIYFLHEKGYRLGIYTLLLLGGKNLVPLVSAAIIQSLGWRWVFWIVAIVVGFGFVLLLLFVPETFWDRTPRPRRRGTNKSFGAVSLHKSIPHSVVQSPALEKDNRTLALQDGNEHHAGSGAPKRHAHFDDEAPDFNVNADRAADEIKAEVREAPPKPETSRANSIPQSSSGGDYFNYQHGQTRETAVHSPTIMPPFSRTSTAQSEDLDPRNAYTRNLESQPKQAWLQQLKPFAGRMSQEKWLTAAIRPFILYAYPSILWSALVYSLSIGWLIVVSESITQIYKSPETYNFSSLQAGLVYISAFIGAILGTAVAGKVSDIMVRWLARRNGGLYEPEFRLFMAAPITLTTVIGLIGFGWSAQVHDAWIVPTVFFGLLSFGCALGSTTSITFAVDSYRQYAGEALVTLNFSKNILHGMVWSLFFNGWLQADGSRLVFLVIGAIQLACMLFAIPMYIFGKRARMWTVRKNMGAKF